MVRAPVAIINVFFLFVRDLLIESYREFAKLIIPTGARTTPIIEISPTHKNPLLETPDLPLIRKSVMSIKFPPAILGPKMAVPIFLVLSAGTKKTHHSIKFLLLGGCWVFLEGGVEVPVLFLWSSGFFRLNRQLADNYHPHRNDYKWKSGDLHAFSLS